MGTVSSDQIILVIRGGVCLYYKESLDVKIMVVFLGNCKGFIAVIYRSSSQNNDQVEIFLSSFEDLINEITPSNPLFYLILGDFNARSSTWWDDDKISMEGTQLDTLSSFQGLHQLIKEPIYLIENSASCIAFILTNQSNLVIDSGVHSSLHSNCYHQIVYCKLNLHIKFPPPYERLVWDYNKANTEKIKKSTGKQVYLENIFNRKYPHQTVAIFNKTIINVFSNFVPNRLITCDDRNPPWMNEFVKNKIKWKNKIYKDHVTNGKTENNYLKLQS